MIEVELPDGTIAEFPDGMPAPQIEQVLSAHYGTAPKAAPRQAAVPKPLQAQQQAPPEPEPMQSLTLDAIPEGLRVEVPDLAVPGGRRVAVARSEFKHVTGRLEIFNRLMDCLAE